MTDEPKETQGTESVAPTPDEPTAGAKADAETGGTAVATPVDTGRFRGYPVHLERFDGPLDLLLDIIKQNKVEIWEISISEITNQYLEYIDSMKALNIEVAGEYLVMAATLMRIKSQHLLPKPSFIEDDEDEEVLTRDALIARLLEYRRFREAAEDLRRRESEQGRRFVRGTVAQLEKGYLLPLREPKVVDLIGYFRDVLTRDDEELRHEVELEEVDLDDQIGWLKAGLAGEVELEEMPNGRGTGIRFSKMLRRPGAVMEVVVTFLAVLELAKVGKLKFWQLDAFHEIWLTDGDGEREADKPEGPGDATLEDQG